MRSIVIGASGIVGNHIVDRLVAAGERPIALSRERRQATDVDWVQADLAAPDALQVPVVSTLYCTAHAGLLAEALPHLYQPELERVVAFTSTSLVTKQNSELAEERDSARSWAEAEQRLIDTCIKLGIAWTVLRPTIIYAEGRDANISRLARLIERVGFMPLAGFGSGLRQPVHAEDLAVGAIAAAQSLAAANKVYALPGTDTVSYHEMIGRNLRWPAQAAPYPAYPAGSVAGCLCDGETVRGKCERGDGQPYVKGHDIRSSRRD